MFLPRGLYLILRLKDFVLLTYCYWDALSAYMHVSLASFEVPFLRVQIF